MNCNDAFDELCRLANCETLSQDDRAVAKQSANVLGFLLQGIYVGKTTPAPVWLVDGVKRLQVLSQVGSNT